MKAIKDLLQRIRNDRAKQQGTWIGIDESHIILNALEKSERIETENAELRAGHRLEVVERALIIMAERALEYAQKANVTAMTSDGLFSCDKNVQLALLVNDALRNAEQEMTEE